MAAVAENSVASVDNRDLAALQVLLLQPRLPITRGPDAAGADVPHQRDDADDDSASAEVVASVDTVRSPVAPAARPRAPPQLAVTKSASAAETNAVVQRSPLHEPSRSMARPASFHGFPDGDTQPMDSQVYRDHTTSMAARSAMDAVTSPKPVLTVRRSPDGWFETCNTNATERTPHTFVEGETGYIDLLEGGWHADLQASPGMRSTTSGIDELLASPQTQLQMADAIRVPTMPETPALAGHKRRSSGEIIGSASQAAMRTPAYSQLFGAFKRPAMSAAELFGQTQAPSSPIPDGPRSDPVVTRPSPNILERATLSSPSIMKSSPLMTMHSRPTSAATGEPKENYTSMQESDERRRAREMEEGAANRIHQHSDDDDESMMDDFLQRPKNVGMQRVMSDQTLHNWSKRRAPSRPPSRPSSSRKQDVTIDLVTPATVRRRPGWVAFEFDEVSNDGDVIAEDEVENGDTGNVDEDDDVYDELAQTVLRSQADVPEEDEQHGDSSEQDGDEDENGEALQRGEEMEADLDNPGRNPETDNGVPGTPAEPDKAVTATQRSAVADSQPQHSEKRQLENLKGHAPSSMASFVPGSQYAGRTSEQQALLRDGGGLRGPNSGGKKDSEATSGMPSSPPLPDTGNTAFSNAANASLARREALAGFQLVHSEPHWEQDEQVIPESDAVLPDAARPRTAEPADQIPANDSNGVLPAPFSTAQTHLSTSGPSPSKLRATEQKSPFKPLDSQHSRTSVDSPRKLAGARRFAHIAADPSPPDASGEAELDNDVDAIMSDILTAEDENFIDIMSSARKRRKLSHRPTLRASSNLISPSKVSATVNPHAIQERRPVVDEVQPITTKSDSCQAQASTTMQSSASKGNERPMSTPETSDPPKGTQESTRKREQAGAAVVSQLLSARSTGISTKLAGRGRKTAAPVEEDVGSKRMDGVGKRRSGSKKSRRGGDRPTDVPYAQGKVAAAPVPDTKPAADVALSVFIPSDQTTEDVAKKHDLAESVDLLARNRIFALFKGTPNNFYPATWLEPSSDGIKQTIRFDDQTTINLDAAHISALELREGDRVKVDDAGMRNKVWIVKGFGRVTQTAEERTMGSDVHGHTTVLVYVKAGGRNSMPTSTSTSAEDSTVREVLVNRIYLTPSMWSTFAKREFIPPTMRGRNATRLNTPTSGIQTPDAETPGSRTRRSIIPSFKAAAQSSHLREESTTIKHPAPPGSGIFNNMAFAISYGSNESKKREITASIQRNGGAILESGFDELFELASLADQDDKQPIANEQAGLQLKQRFAGLGFVALIADRHSRRAKYVQALALGLPTLSGRWIMDSLALATGGTQSKSPTTASVDWSRYLLAAGESSYLNGAVRSRTLRPYSAAGAKLADTIVKRETLLGGDGVLIIASKKHRAWERRKAYAFLTLALGAARVRRVNDLVEAKTLLKVEIGRWKWVYVDGPVAEASKVLFLSASGATGAKRKREEVAVKVEAKAMVAVSAEGDVRAVNDEFVVQSLILGALVD
ncbi:hypothetical protein LTR62_008522 [Meristemomyces frigidus]|uniref:BRCT domain-containing protein n=1 Tax=Meristemomyces frigidus TaxID=1508187 RepID=A0AAN7TP66_9PEZI|nr:hypothetical protein LTR62_008522 [Meristemomyces frigidus]